MCKVYINGTAEILKQYTMTIENNLRIEQNHKKIIKKNLKVEFLLTFFLQLLSK